VIEAISVAPPVFTRERTRHSMGAGGPPSLTGTPQFCLAETKRDNESMLPRWVRSLPFLSETPRGHGNRKGLIDEFDSRSDPLSQTRRLKRRLIYSDLDQRSPHNGRSVT
jgi:hypothetical protein